MKLLKKHIPFAIVFVFGMLTLISYYVPHTDSVTFLDTVSQWENTVSSFAFLLGLFSLFYSHYSKISKKVDGWGYSIFVFVGFLAIVIPAFISHGEQMVGPLMTPLGWAFRYIYNALLATMFAVLAFYIVSTAYRSFRIKSVQAMVLFISALILIIGRVPIGELMWGKTMGWTGYTLSGIMNWIVDVPSVAGKRGIMIGLAIGAVVTSLKIVFGIERQYLGKD
jgi:hypothetical protein